MSDALKSNTTLTQLNLWSEHQENNALLIFNQQFTLFHFHQTTENKIGERGTTSLSDVLKTNKTLKVLDLQSRQK